LVLNFSAAIDGLTTSDITLATDPTVWNGGKIITGNFSGPVTGSNATLNYTLGISNFTSGGSLSVSVKKPGYDISGSPKPVAIISGSDTQ